MEDCPVIRGGIHSHWEGWDKVGGNESDGGERRDGRVRREKM